MYATTTGEQRTVALDDGSRVVLDTGSDLKVQYGRRERRLTLLRGRADFRVQHDSDRPFVVLVGDASVTATGTRFQVRTADDAGAGNLLEGEVVVAATGGGQAGGGVTLRGGEGVAIRAAGWFGGGRGWSGEARGGVWGGAR